MVATGMERPFLRTVRVVNTVGGGQIYPFVPTRSGWMHCIEHLDLSKSRTAMAW